jgi:vacuolar-type H+-ATPase subunit C/Vma6
MVNTALINASTLLTNITNSTALNATSRFAFLHNLGNPVFLSFALPLILVVSIVVFVTRNVLPVGHFLYSNARIQARTPYMITEDMLSSLIESKSLKEFRNLLKDTAYAQELEKSKEDLRSFHIALEKGFIDSIKELIELSPEKSKPLFNSYIMFVESKILKIFYRARFVGAVIDENLVYAIGIIDDNLIKHLSETKTLADIGVVMAPTIYSGIFAQKYDSLEEFEVAIDQFVLNKLISIIRITKMYDGRFIIDVLNKKIDILNILAILKFKVRGISKERQMKLLICNNTQVCTKLEALVNESNLTGFVELFKGLPYYEPMKRALDEYQKDNAISHFENELYKFFKREVIGNDLSHTLGPYPLFSYLIRRELELRNLFIVSKSIDAGFSAEKMKRMII